MGSFSFWMMRKRGCFAIASTSDVAYLFTSFQENPMPLLLSEADVKTLLTMPLALEAVEGSFRRLADGTAVLQYRQRLRVPGKTVLNYMAAADIAGGYLGLKIYSISSQ